MSVKERVADKDTLDVLNVHVVADSVLKLEVAAEVGMSAVKACGIVAGLKNDLVNYGLECVGKPCSIACGEVLICIELIYCVGILVNGNCFRSRSV